MNGSDGLNRKYDVFTLEDDLNFFPEYYAVYFVRMDLENEYPGVEAALNKISGIFSEEKMMQMNYEVDVLSESPEEVMRNFLTNEGLLK